MHSVTLLRNIGLSDVDTAGQTSVVGEPSLGAADGRVFYTGNWYASRSLDDGATWQYTSPFNFGTPADGFCCDQTVIYDPSRNLMVWLLQYVKANNSGVLRVAVNAGATLDPADWVFWDFEPVGVDAAWAGEWFDYNHAALSDNFLYVGTNVFGFANDDFRRCLILKFPLDDLAGGANLGYSVFSTTQFGSLRCTQGAQGTMYFADHVNSNTITVFAWPENSNTITQSNIGVAPSSGTNYQAPGPSGNNWLGRVDRRITGGWVANGTLGFMWTASQLGATRPMPYVRVVRIDEASMTLTNQPDIWSPQHAFAYPSAYPNASGDVGISLFRGGGNLHPGHVVGALPANETAWILQPTMDGTHGPPRQVWGDYTTCRRNFPDGQTWVAAGFTLQGGGARTDIEPRFVRFELTPTPPPPTPGPTPPPPTPGPTPPPPTPAPTKKPVCFVATAAYGSEMEPSVQYLREFRDDVLLRSRFRQVFEWLFDVYRRAGPPVAHAMSKHSSLKYAIRYGLIWPLVRVLKLGGRIRSLSFQSLRGRRP